MIEKPLLTVNMVCKYDEYFHPQLKRNASQMKFPTFIKKYISQKNRHSNTFNTPISNESNRNLFEMRSTHTNSVNNFKSLNQNRNAQKIRKCQGIKLQRIPHKSVSEKFQDLHDSISNDKHQIFCKNSNRKNLTISPLKIFQIVENKYYLDLQSEKKNFEKKCKQNDQDERSVMSLFNVKSIKTFKRNTYVSNCDHHNYEPISKDQLKKLRKYDRKLRNNSQFQQLSGQNYQKKLNNIKFRKSVGLNYKESTFEPSDISCIQNSQNNCKKLKLKHQINQTLSNEKTENKSLGLLESKTRKSKQSSPNSYSLKPYNTFISDEKSLFDNRYQNRKNSDTIFEDKLLNYMAMLMTNGQIHNIKIQFPQSYSRNQLKIYVGNGNNSKLVKEILKKRWWLGSCQQKKDILKNNVVWTQIKDKAYFTLNQNKVLQNIQQSPIQKKLFVHNHFQHNQFLGNKKALYYNMKAYYQSIGENVFDYLPLTLHFKNLQDETWKQFLKYFQEFEDKNPGSKNIWILKPGENSNRGNGITVHKTVQSIKNTVNKNHKEGRTFIIQKYIENPFLYQKRKFDIRCYMLLTRLNGQIKGFWYKQGYFRTSGHQYTLENCQNQYIHLTNDAIQQHCASYGKFEDKNKLSYKSFQRYLDGNFNLNNQTKRYDFERDIIPKLKKVCEDSIKASYKYLGKWRQGLPTFQLFGLDFMIDDNFKPWLIEINTNPCIQTQGRVLEKVIAPLIDNVFKLTIDCIFPPPKNWSNSNKYLLSKNVQINNFQLVFQQKLWEKSLDKEQLANDFQMQKIEQIDEDSLVYFQKQQ